MEKNKINLIFGMSVSLIVIIGFIYVATSNTSTLADIQSSDDVDGTLSDTNLTTGNKSVQDSTTDQQIVESKYTSLSVVASRCRGCGKCAMIDSEHFKMSGRVATVISSANLDSSDLQSAVYACPGSAIILT